MAPDVIKPLLAAVAAAVAVQLVVRLAEMYQALAVAHSMQLVLGPVQAVAHLGVAVEADAIASVVVVVLLLLAVVTPALTVMLLVLAGVVLWLAVGRPPQQQPDCQQMPEAAQPA